MRQNEQINFDLPVLPPDLPTPDAEQTARLIKASRQLAELKGLLRTLPNPNLLLQPILLQEARASSEIENIVTTQDELYTALAAPASYASLSVEQKEAVRYRQAVTVGFEGLIKGGGISTSLLVQIMQEIKWTGQGIRTQPTSIRNATTHELIFTPPSGSTVIAAHMSALERYINSDHAIDPLIQLALVHYQFEAIHPFADGNGRTGRILNVLFLVHKGLLDHPLLYLSGFINRNRPRYYARLRGVTDRGDWNPWIDFMLEGVADTSAATIVTIQEINGLKETWDRVVGREIPRAPTRKIVDLMLSYPYLKIATLENDGIAKRQTASRYLHLLADAGLLRVDVRGRETYFVNERLAEILGR